MGSWPKVRLVGAVAAVGGLMIGGPALVWQGGPTSPRTGRTAPAPVPPPGAPAPGRDQFGARLPKGAVARLGTLRLRHGDGLERVALSADGKRVVSSGRSAVRFWDTTTGQELMPPLTADPGEEFLAGAPTRDG